MNFWNIAVLGLTFFAPCAAVLFVALKVGRAPGSDLKASAVLFGLGMAAAALGVARMSHPIRMELLWPVTLEQSGYFEFSLLLLWTRFVFVFLSAGMLLGYAVYDAPAAPPARNRLLFLTGAFFFSTLAFLCENVLLSLMFVEVAGFMLHAFGMESREEEELEKSSYFKRSCFVFLGLTAMLAIVVTRQFSTGSVMILGAVLYILSIAMSKNNPSRWSQIPLLLLQLGFALFLLERVMMEDSPAELWIPLSAIFAVGTVALASVSLLTPGSLGASFWMVLSMLAYLLYLRFSSSKPGDSFWGAYEAIGLCAAYAISLLFRFGDRLDILWKRALAFLLLAVVLGVVSGALPSVEVSASRFDSETSIARVAILSFLTFLVALVSSKGLAVSLGKSREASSPLPALAPAVVLLVLQGALLAKWNDLNFEEIAAGGLGAMLYDTRVLVTSAAVAIGLLAGGLLGTNGSFANWTKSRDLRMENLFPRVDPMIVQRGLELIQLPERFIQWLTAKIASASGTAAGSLDTADRTFFSERFFRGFAGYSSSLSQFTRFFHSGQARAYLFLGVIVTLISSLLFLLEGR